MDTTLKFGLSLFSLAMLVLAFTAPSPAVHLVVAAGTPDAYGQQIQFVLIHQYESGAWVLRKNVTTALYSAGYDVDVYPAEATRFLVCTEYNDDFNTAKTESEALADVRVYITISGGELAQTLMTDINATYRATGDWWRGWSSYTWNSTGKPTAGASYTVTIQYQAFLTPDEYTP